jgi:hypothetical protein
MRIDPGDFDRPLTAKSKIRNRCRPDGCKPGVRSDSIVRIEIEAARHHRLSTQTRNFLSYSSLSGGGIVIASMVMCWMRVTPEVAIMNPQVPDSFTRTLKLKVRPEAYGWLGAAAIEVNQVFNFCVRREVASLIVAAIATDSPMSRTLGGHAELVTARYEAPLTMYLRALERRCEPVRVSAVLAASSR